MKTTTVVLFVIMLFLLFEKTESSESSESGESTESIFRQFAQFAVSDSTDSMFSRKVAPMVSQSLASEEFLNSGVSRLYDELCSQLCERKTLTPKIMHCALCIESVAP